LHRGAPFLNSRRARKRRRLSYEATIRRLTGAQLLEQNDGHAIEKLYMSLESSAAMSENPPIRLPAAPALA